MFHDKGKERSHNHPIVNYKSKWRLCFVYKRFHMYFKFRSMSHSLTKLIIFWQKSPFQRKPPFLRYITVDLMSEKDFCFSSNTTFRILFIDFYFVFYYLIRDFYDIGLMLKTIKRVLNFLRFYTCWYVSRNKERLLYSVGVNRFTMFIHIIDI